MKLVDTINKSKYKKLIYLILIILAIILLVFILSILFNKDKNNVYDENNKNIVVSKEYKEKPGTFIRNTKTLKKEHCKENLCIKNIMIYYNKNEGRIEYEITNKGKRKATGVLKLKFDNGKKIFIVYNKLKKKETNKGVISFSNNDFSNVYDYTLDFASEKEIDKLFNNKK